MSIDLMHQLLTNQPTSTLYIRVTPNASANRIKDVMLVNGTLKLYVYLTAQAQDGKANEALIKLLAKELKIAKSAIKIVSGLKYREKILKIIKFPSQKMR